MSKETKSSEKPEWKQEEILVDHLSNGSTYQEIADQYDDATFDTVGYWVRKYDLTANHLRPKYTDNNVPLRLIADTDVEHPLPVHFVEEYAIENKDYGRFTARQQGEDIVVDIEVGDHIDGKHSSDRKLVQRQTKHFEVRHPRMLVHALGVAHAVEGGDGEAHLIKYDDNTIRVEFTPSITPWDSSVDGEATPEVEQLTEKVKPLLPLFDSTVPDDERGADDIEKYRLDLPLSYISAYDLEAGDEVVLHIGPVPDGDNLGLFVDFTDDTADAPKSLVRTLQSYRNGTEDAPREQVCFYPGMTLLHCLGVGVEQVRPSVRVEPGPRHVAIIPM